MGIIFRQGLLGGCNNPGFAVADILQVFRQTVQV